MSRIGETYKFEDLYELEKIYEEELPDVEKTGDIFAAHPDKDETDTVWWRTGIFTKEEHPRLCGEVSDREGNYHVHQYSDILEYAKKGLEQHDGLDPSGKVSVSSPYHRMTSKINFGENIEPVDGDVHNIGLALSSGHAGFYATKVDVGAEREVCSNGMTAFVSEFNDGQYHNQPLNPGMIFTAIDGIAEGTDVIEERLADAQKNHLKNLDEAILVIRDFNVGNVLENPVDDLRKALNQEVSDPSSPTQKEVYDAATRALTHYVGDDVDEVYVDDELERAARILDQDGNLPDSEDLGRKAVQNRSREYIENRDEVEEYWDGEEDDIRELMEVHGVEA